MNDDHDPFGQRFGRALRPVPTRTTTVRELDLATIRADVALRIAMTGSFEFHETLPQPTPLDRIVMLLRNAGVSEKKIGHTLPGIANIILAAEIDAFRKGSEGAQSRLACKPGDGDMGG